MVVHVCMLGKLRWCTFVCLESYGRARLYAWKATVVHVCMLGKLWSCTFVCLESYGSARLYAWKAMVVHVCMLGKLWSCTFVCLESYGRARLGVQHIKLLFPFQLFTLRCVQCCYWHPPMPLSACRRRHAPLCMSDYGGYSRAAEG